MTVWHDNCQVNSLHKYRLVQQVLFIVVRDREAFLKQNCP